MQEGKRSVSESIAGKVKKEIELGIITDGEKLTSCRELALELGVNPNTVQKAYAMLESEGYIEVMPQKGAYAKRSLFIKQESLAGKAEKQIAELKKQGLTKDQLMRIAERLYGDDND